MDQVRLPVFSLAASMGYTLAYYFNWPPLVYYPLVNELRIVPTHGRLDGFPILWYGWLATAIVIGAVAAAVTPLRWARRLPVDLTWIVPIVLIVAAVTYEKRWF
jgi:hypothetical protein